jgi:glycosyltransferase involved in cell wall biosynthesis
MKVTQISTSNNGGAGIAASRLHCGLMQEGIESTFLSLNNSANTPLPQSYVFNNETPLSFGQRLQRKIGIPVTQAEKNQARLSALGGEYEIFSFPYSDYAVEQHPQVLQSAVVNLHWVAGFVNYPTFFHLQKPIVWTLHDMNPFMGGFHYAGDLSHNKSAFAPLENSLMEVKRQAYANHKKKLTIVTPSAWLGNKTKQSELMGGFDIRVIPNAIDTAIFKHQEQAFARKVLNLPADKQILLFVSDRLDSKRKGFDILLETIMRMPESNDSILLTVGNQVGELSFPQQLINLGKITDERLMSIAYSAADAFILPSREDNLPNVMLESMACGTPVIAFETGGIPEVVQHGFNGVLAPAISSQSLYQAIELFNATKDSFNRASIAKFAHEHFNLSVQAKRYSELYHEIII